MFTSMMHFLILLYAAGFILLMLDVCTAECDQEKEQYINGSVALAIVLASLIQVMV